MERQQVRSFEDLIVWQKAIQLAKDVYMATSQGSISKDYGLKDQLRRASVSISANIAEGFEREGLKEYLHFLNISKGSTGEVRSLLQIALEVAYLPAVAHGKLRESALELSRFLANQMKSLRKGEGKK